MLVLTRRVGEALQIGDNIKVIIVGARGERARIGIHAPKTVPIDQQPRRKRHEDLNSPAPPGEL